MIGTGLRYVTKAPRVAAVVARDPLEALIRLRTKLVEAREHRRPPCAYTPDPAWECGMHERLGCALPCDAAAECRALWPDAIEALRRRGLRVGPASFGIWNDGDPEFVRAVWCLVRHLQPAKVVETGVARGLTSRFILEALARNGHGRLWSIDLPPALDTALHAQIGAAVEPELRERWTYVEGSSRRRLPGLLAELGEIDLFVHDSMHTEDNVRFELDRAWAVLRPGGAVVVDDIDLNWGFHSFAAAHPACGPLACQAEPLSPDPRRFDGRGLFGIAWKSARPRSAAS
jgi:hypothetical protein